jgi:hypothetical protein
MIGKGDGNAVPELPSEDAANVWKILGNRDEGLVRKKLLQGATFPLGPK